MKTFLSVLFFLLGNRALGCRKMHTHYSLAAWHAAFIRKSHLPPIVVVTYNHKCQEFKATLVLLQLWRSEIQNNSRALKSRLAWLGSLERLRQNLLSCYLEHLEVATYSTSTVLKSLTLFPPLVSGNDLLLQWTHLDDAGASP